MYRVSLGLPEPVSDSHGKRSRSASPLNHNGKHQRSDSSSPVTKDSANPERYNDIDKTEQSLSASPLENNSDLKSGSVSP